MEESDERADNEATSSYCKLVDPPIVGICVVVQKDLDVGSAVKPGGDVCEYAKRRRGLAYTAAAIVPKNAAPTVLSKFGRCIGKEGGGGREFMLTCRATGNRLEHKVRVISHG